MAKFRVNKIDAARRQLETAIRLFFDDGDAVSVHTLASASARILRDLCKQKRTPMHQSVAAMIVPGKEGAFWAAMNRPANFFKHADKDADDILDDVDEQANDFELFLACLLYSDLGYQLTWPMQVLVNWFSMLHPDLMLDTNPQKQSFASSEVEPFRRATRTNQLAFGKRALARGGRSG